MSRAKFKQRHGVWSAKDGQSRVRLTGIELIKNNGRMVILVDLAREERLGNGRGRKASVATSTRTLVGMTNEYD